MKKILAIGLLLLLLVLSGCTSSKYNDEAPWSEATTNTNTGTGANEPSETAPPAQEEPANAPNVYKLNEPFVVGGLQYTFKSTAPKEEIGYYSEYAPDDFIGSKANGVYIIVELEIKNVGKKAEYLTSSNIKVVDVDNREFETDSSAAYYLGMDPEFKGAKALSFAKLNPGLTQNGYIVFDIPEDLKGGIQVVDNSMFPSEVAWVDVAE